MSLGEVLDHPSLVRAEPLLVTGRAHTSRVVRWVHSSEILDIAPLLRGGELLLTGGSMLAEASAQRQRAYIRELASKGVTAAAVETTTEDCGLPEALVQEAASRDFALIQLDRTAPFVEIAESINGLLVNDSVQRLRLADSLSDVLSAELTSGADVLRLAESLAVATDSSVTVRDRTGDVLAASPGSSAPITGAMAQLRQAPITVHGVTTAFLELHPGPDVDAPVLDATLDRAPQAFALALLRSRPPTPGARAARGLFQALEDIDRSGEDLAPLIEAAGLDADGTFVALAATHADPTFYGALEQATRNGGRHALGHVTDQGFLALVTLAPHHPEQSRRDLVDDVHQVVELGTERPTVGIGPLVSSYEDLGHTVAEARRCVDPDLADAAVNGVVDARQCSLHRLVHQLDSDATLEQFVGEQLGTLLRQPADVRYRLLHTLEVFFDCAANKTEAAQRLHLGRQSLYQRLDKLSRHLGREVTDPASLADLQVAVRLWRILEQRRDVRSRTRSPAPA